MSATITEVTASWTKHNDQWAVCVPNDADVHPGDQITVVNRAGAEKTVTILAHVDDKPWGAVWILAPRDPEPQTDTVPEGYYHRDGQVFKVRTSAKGNTYATVLTRTTTASGAVKGKWEYQPGAIRSLTADHAITIEQAAEYGHLHGFCAICGKTLTDPASVERGIGPVCAKKIAPAETRFDCHDDRPQASKMELRMVEIRGMTKPDHVADDVWQSYIAELIEAAQD